MLKKCHAKCRANISKAPVPHLWLRKNIFYCRIELPKENGKQRYFFQSLHTKNYYEALTKMKPFENIETKFYELSTLYKQIKFTQKPIIPTNTLPSKHYGLCNVKFETIIDKNTDKNLVEEVIKKINTLENNISLLNQTLQDQFNEMLKNKSIMMQFIQSMQSIQPTLPQSTNITIQEILDIMLSTANNKKEETQRKKLFIIKALKQINLKLTNDYSKFHNPNSIKDISNWIVNMKNVKGDCKNKYLRYIKNLLTAGFNAYPNIYNQNIILTIPKITKTKAIDRTGHIPYSNEELLKIFDSNKDFFKKEPDIFWICMIALFTGARRNASMTLQYKDIVMKDNLHCIYFNEDHAIKQLKTDASIRYVPIHKQLLDLGFIDYIENKKKKDKATDEDFIFPKCKTKTGNFNSRYLLRTFSKFLFELNIKKGNNDGHDFHSFRNNLSLAMQNANISNVIINKVIGWQGESIMENSYSKYTLQEIKNNLDKFSYDFLQPEFDEWKKIMGKK